MANQSYWNQRAKSQRDFATKPRVAAGYPGIYLRNQINPEGIAKTSKLLLMPQSLDQVYLHTIFSTKDRVPIFKEPILRTDLYAYLAAVSNNLDCKAIKVGGHIDHIHILTKHPRTITIANFVKELKRVSSQWIRSYDSQSNDFSWQAGYGVFSVSASNIEEVENYISNQEKHHQLKSFQEEYLEFLKRHNVEFDDKYLLD